MHGSNFLVGFFSADFVFANLIYYVFGIALRQKEERIQNILANQYVSFLLLAIAVLPCAFELPWSMVGSVICKIAYLLIFYMLFKHFSAKFEEQKNILSKGLCCIGRNTLPIYFIHYFFLFKIDFICRIVKSMLTDYCFRGHSCSFIVELFFVGLMALAISCVCIFVKKMLETFPLVTKLWFGESK